MANRPGPRNLQSYRQGSGISYSRYRLFPLLAFAIFSMAAACDENSSSPGKVIESRDPVNGIRISWDYNSLQRLAPLNRDRNLPYFGYARMIQLSNGDVLCIYETSDGNTEMIRSTDTAKTWSVPAIVFQTRDNINMAVPEIFQISDGSILAACNLRPGRSDDPTYDEKFGISVKRSTDNGFTWSDEQVVYEAGSAFENGCWEPAFTQLPEGQVLLFFANEGDYLSTNEQNISLLRSDDGGVTWSEEREIVSFRAGHRDGMPVPLLLPEDESLIVAIEDNGHGEFKPSVLRYAIDEEFSTVSADDPRREYALAKPLSQSIYAGAPYFRKLKSGEVLLSYQSTENRNKQWDKSAMRVAIGDANGLNFNRQSTPFPVPLEKSGLWNSLSLLNDNTPVAITTTNAWSSAGMEVWMIKGRIIPELSIAKSTISQDGYFKEDVWQSEWPVFIGHKGPASLNANLSWDEEYLYLALHTKDKDRFMDSENIGEDDGIVVTLDPKNRSLNVPDRNIFKLVISLNGAMKLWEGNAGEWAEIPEPKGLKSTTVPNEENIYQEVAIPWNILNVDTGEEKKGRINFVLLQDNDGSLLEYKDVVSPNEEDASYSWFEYTLTE